MRAYSGLAQIYDYLLCGINYDEWVDYLEQLFKHFAINPKHRIIDLACGTGNSTLPWAKRGYEVYGVDISAEMLSLARKKAQVGGLPAIFYQQDLRNLELPVRGDIAVLYQDGLNYLLSLEELRCAFKSIYACVSPGGFFIFNLNLVEKLPGGTTAQVSFFDESELTLFWESAYLETDKIWRINLIAFLKGEGGFYRKIQEEHRERSHSREELESLFAETGWCLQACFKAFTLESPSEQDRNVFFVIQRDDF